MSQKGLSTVKLLILAAKRKLRPIFLSKVIGFLRDHRAQPIQGWVVFSVSVPKQSVSHGREFKRQWQHHQVELFGSQLHKMARRGKDEVGVRTQAGGTIEIWNSDCDIALCANVC